MTLQDVIQQKLSLFHEYKFIDSDGFFLVLKGFEYLNREEFEDCFVRLKNIFKNIPEFENGILSPFENYAAFIFTEESGYKFVFNFYSY